MTPEEIKPRLENKHYTPKVKSATLLDSTHSTSEGYCATFQRQCAEQEQLNEMFRQDLFEAFLNHSPNKDTLAPFADALLQQNFGGSHAARHWAIFNTFQTVFQTPTLTK